MIQLKENPQEEDSYMEVKYNNKMFYIVSVKDHLSELNPEMMNYVLSRDVNCHLLEVDFTLRRNDIINKPYLEPTTKKIVKILKDKNQCIQGWDIRPSYLKYKDANDVIHEYNDALYGVNKEGIPFMYELTLFDILNIFINKLDLRGRFLLENQKVNPIVKDYINKELLNYNQENIKKTYTNQNGLFDRVVKTLQAEKTWNTVKLGDLIKTNEQREIVQKLIYSLKIQYMNISDLTTLKMIMHDDNQSFTIFLGSAHFINLRRHFKNIGIELNKK